MNLRLFPLENGSADRAPGWECREDNIIAYWGRGKPEKAPDGDLGRGVVVERSGVVSPPPLLPHN